MVSFPRHTKQLLNTGLAALHIRAESHLSLTFLHLHYHWSAILTHCKGGYMLSAEAQCCQLHLMSMHAAAHRILAIMILLWELACHQVS